MELKAMELKEYLEKNEFANLIKKVSENVIEFDNDVRHGEVRIHFVNEFEIVELDIQNKKNNTSDFYLHFEYQNLEHAKELFHDFLAAMNKSENKTVKVLFSCSSALTTSFFAQKMNEAVGQLGLDYQFNAVNYTELYQVGQDYDMVLLAPQVSYMLGKVKSALKDQLVLAIPARIFANYDVAKMIEFIKENIQIKNKERKGKLFFKQLPAHTGEILTISFLKNSSRVHIYTKVYSKGNRLLLENKAIYSEVTLQDIYDVIDKNLKLYPNIEAVGLSLGGLIQNSVIHEFFIEALNEKNLDTLFKDKYHLPFVYSDAITCAAVGYYANQDEYTTVCVLYQPISSKGRLGLVINGRAYSGCHNLIGDLQHLPLSFSDKYSELIKTPEGASEVFIQLIQSIDLLVDPECIVIASQLLTDLAALQENVHQRIQYNSPKLLEIGAHWHEYICYGQLALVVKSLNKNSK